MLVIQTEVVLPSHRRGVHLVTEQLLEGWSELRRIETGLLHVFLCHTSASLTINENADPDVRRDLNMALDRIAPENWPYCHTCEGPDDMPAHIKASLMGSALTIPLRGGRPALGTWQGIYLCEHRDRGGRRRIILTAMGTPQK